MACYHAELVPIVIGVVTDGPVPRRSIARDLEGLSEHENLPGAWGCAVIERGFYLTYRIIFLI
jgi:hypothetical protein